MKKRKKSFRRYFYPLIILVLIPAVIFSAVKCSQDNKGKSPVSFERKDNTVDSEDIIGAFAREHGLKTEDYPPELIELLDKNPETKDFVLNYPLEKDKKTKTDLTKYENCGEVPLLLQWDRRWGYAEYAGELMGISGCGPTCLSMVSIYILNDGTYSPTYIARFAEKNGYASKGNGSSWSLISEGGKKLGLKVSEIPLDKNRIIKNLEAGNPVICVMGPGDFTSTGHFIVMTRYTDGKIRINDPNSITRSEMLWDYDDIKDQIRNLWVCG
ncbi:MAG: secreted protein containing domain of murein hydrolase [Ruminococcaceae bacterium]|nr:secreted protein containing domain of murein hydrolase [Oscillospiraceae bacterium]